MRAQREFQYTECVRVPYFAVFVRRNKRAVIFSTGSGNEFANAASLVWFSFRILRSEPFVVVIVAIHDYVRVRMVERLPERSQ